MDDSTADGEESPWERLWTACNTTITLAPTVRQALLSLVLLNGDVVDGVSEGGRTGILADFELGTEFGGLKDGVVLEYLDPAAVVVVGSGCLRYAAKKMNPNTDNEMAPATIHLRKLILLLFLPN